MAIGGGFVRSGSGYVSTPATRASQRAAGTFGSGSGITTRLISAAKSSLSERISTAAAAQRAKILSSYDLNTIAGIEASARFQRIGMTAGQERVIIERAQKLKAALRKKQQDEAALRESAAACSNKPKPTIMPRYFTTHNITPTPGHDWICKDGVWVWTMDAAEKVQVDKAIAASDAAPFTNGAATTPRAADITKIATTPPKVPAQGAICPHGNRYSPEGFDKCTAGYHEVWEGWFPTRRRYCDCDTAPPEEGEKGVPDVLNALAKGEINLNSIILLAAVVMLIISLIKR